MREQGKVEKALREALELVKPSYRWIKGKFVTTQVHAGKRMKCFCAQGAIREVTGEGTFQADFATRDAAEILLLKAANRLTRKGFSWVPDWNDRPKRTHQQVVQAFELAIKKAKEQGV